MNIFDHFRKNVVAIVEELAASGALPPGLDTARLSVEPPRDSTHGDITTNAAMVLAKPAGIKPRDLATLFIERLKAIPTVLSAEVAGPGFINLKISDSFWHDRLREILLAGTAYGDSTMGGGEAVNVEFVSANPTGPMHVGHGRGAVVGDALASLLDKAGFKVTREYYINDAGVQVDVLARSAHLRYREALGEAISDIPEGLYPGDYLVPLGQTLAARFGDRWQSSPEDAWLTVFREAAVAAMLDLIREDLAALGVRFDKFSSELALVADGKVDEALADMKARGLIYEGILETPKGMTPDDWEPRPQTLFRATQFGDDVDRPLQKSDGSWTYFASDIAYHRDKYRRGFKSMIDVWGADHGGYVKRMQAAVKSFSGGEAALDVKLCQMILLLDNGEPVKMSKRAGTFVTLREVIDRVGKDVVRFIMLIRRNDAQLEFDLAQVMEQSRDNPVFYVQYAHARVRSVLRHAAASMPALDLSSGGLANVPLGSLTDESEIDLIRTMAAWPHLVEQAAEAHEPHRIAYYLNDLAAKFHALWNKGRDEAHLRFLIAEEPERTAARLALISSVATVVASGLNVFGVAPVEEMR
jgi:arginyl-tRNA synthetase